MVRNLPRTWGAPNARWTGRQRGDPLDDLEPAMTLHAYTILTSGVAAALGWIVGQVIGRAVGTGQQPDGLDAPPDGGAAENNPRARTWNKGDRYDRRVQR